MGTRGVKPKPRAKPRAPLTQRVPPGLSAPVAKVYKALVRELAVEGYACQADWRTVLLAAETQAHLSRLTEEVARLKSYTLPSVSGERLHPLVTELRAVRVQLASLYAQLLLTPRSRSASRMTEAQARATTAANELEDF